MRRVVIFGNSGSGKSTLAESLSQSEGLPHFDLDSIAWLPTDPPERSPLQECADQIKQFLTSHDSWVIEGCYADLINLAVDSAPTLWRDYREAEDNRDCNGQLPELWAQRLG